jgi:hypothetical protein
MTTKNVKIALKPEIHSKQKNFSSSDLIFLGVFKVKKKYMILTPLVIWNHLTKKKNNSFGGQIPYQLTLSLSKSKSNDLLSLFQ